MKTISALFLAAILALTVSSCAGVKTHKMPATARTLPETVPESFHFRVNDPETCGYLNGVDPDALPADQRLEVVLLRELAAVSSENETAGSFDRLWNDHEELRNLVRNPHKRREFVQPMAIAYYLLSTAPASSWQAETAERLYREGLAQATPAQVKGYGLHFYTLALLKKGKFDEALPLLHNLKYFTSPEIYLQDLTTALDYALNSRAAKPACGIMASICENGIQHNLEIPDNRLEKAIMTLKAMGALRTAREELAPLVRDNPGLQRYSFVQMFIQTPEGFHKQPSKKEENGNLARIKTQDRPLKPSKQTFHKQVTIARNQRETARGVRVEIQVISACRGPDYVDPLLLDAVKALKETVHFSSFRLIAEKLLEIPFGEEKKMTISKKRKLKIMPRYSTGRSCRIQLVIEENGKQTFSTVLETVDGGTAIIGGAVDDGRMLLLRLRNFILPYIRSPEKLKITSILYDKNVKTTI